MSRKPKDPLPPQGDVYCGRCGYPYPSDPYPAGYCPACGCPEFSLTPGVLTEGYLRDVKGTLFETWGGTR